MKNIFEDANNVAPAQEPEQSAPVAQEQQAPPMQQNTVPNYGQVPPQYGQAPVYGQPMYGQYPYPNPYMNSEQPQSPYAQPVQPQAPQQVPQQAPQQAPQQGFDPNQISYPQTPQQGQPMVNPYAQMPYGQAPYYPMYGMPYMQPQFAPYGTTAYPSIPQDQMEQMVQQYLKDKDKTEEEQTEEARAKTRVIFQSEDFDEEETLERKVDSSAIQFNELGEIVPAQEDEEIETSLEFKPEVKEESSILTTELGEGFSVFEVEIAEKELSMLARKHPVKITRLDAPNAAPVIHKVSGEYQEERIEKFIVEEYDENGELIDLSTELEKVEGDEEVQKMKKFKFGKNKKEKKEKKPRSKGELARLGVLVVAILGIVGSSAWLGYEYYLSAQNDSLSQSTQDLLIDVNSLVYSDSNTQSDDVSTETVLTEEEQWELIYAEYPDIDFPDGMLLQYANLYATNQDMVGYLSIEGLDYSTPVVQGDDDDDYIATNFYGESTKYACPFMTYLNNPDELDTNTVIFGHNMSNGSIFAELNDYKDIQGFLDAPVISFDTLTGEYEWKIIAAFITNAYEEDDDGYVFQYYFTNLSSEENFAIYLSELESRSLYYTGVDVLPTDKLLTLSTCSYEFDDARFVVVARMVRLGESSEVDTSLASANSSVRYPQAYYDAKGKTNPYTDAYLWYPS